MGWMTYGRADTPGPSKVVTESTGKAQVTLTTPLIMQRLKYAQHRLQTVTEQGCKQSLKKAANIRVTRLQTVTEPDCKPSLTRL